MFIRKGQHTTRFRSKKSEAQAARVFSGKVQPGSGSINQLGLKGDVKSEIFLVDDKLTDNDSYSFKIETWRKLSTEAWGNRRRPAMRINFTKSEPLIIVDEVTFMDMLNAWKAAGYK